jgi:hypothetical protein
VKASKFGLSVIGLIVVSACAGGGNATIRPSTGAGASTGPSTAASMAPESMGSESMAPTSMTPESMAPESMGAESMAPESMGHESMAPASMAPESGNPASPDASAGAGVDINSAAANLRVDLNYLLGEHQILAFKATGAALGGRSDQFDAYANLMNTNGTDLGAAIGSIYGQEAQDEFNRIWSAHNGFFVDYTTGVATDDQAKADKAVEDLTTIYVPEFTTFLVGATGLPEDAVTELVTDHVTHTKEGVDAQASGDFEAAYAAIREAYSHIMQIGDALAPAIAETNSIEGDATAPGVTFRTTLNQYLQEHLFLASFATDAAIGGRDDEFAAAGAALNENGTELGAVVGDLFGSDAQDEWNRIWSAHNGFFVDYTTGVATDDQAKADKAVQDLTTIYVPEFTTFLAGATGLPEDALSQLITDHVLTTKAIVDAQRAGDVAGAANADRTAAMHMRMLGDPLAEAIVNAMPDSFR